MIALGNTFVLLPKGPGRDLRMIAPLAFQQKRDAIYFYSRSTRAFSILSNLDIILQDKKTRTNRLPEAQPFVGGGGRS